VLDLELFAVQIEEAGRLAKIRRLPHLRLAFLLLDNVVEVTLHREVECDLLGRLPHGHDATSVLSCLTGLLEQVPEALRRTLTWDQGREMARHAELGSIAGIEVFFAEPHHPWQRPSNEAFNGLLRRYVGRERTSPSRARPTSMRSVTASTRCPDGSITDAQQQTAIILLSLPYSPTIR